ncbi:glycosyltransferase family 4 protein [Halapricum sp. CBA1109]|uniref:glycosyltransferase family 4 protein n=1 Tax=Halapricum sp. CBA1109 TaxID=2668068 RepID=UPI0018D254AD|nr:glycosyltransferase family 4 protein [Halapricum sp. CBA1109]
MRIVFITQEVDRDGDILGFVHRWLELFGTHPSVEHVHAVCLREGRHDLPDSVSVHPVSGDGRAGKAEKFLRMQSTLFRLKRRHDIDVIFAHMCEIYVTLSFPYAVGDTVLAYWKTHAGLSRHIRFAHDRADVLFTASEESFDLDSAKKTPVGHGIDTTMFTPNGTETDGRDRILSIGRMTESKHHERLVEATGRLVEAGRNVQLDLVGGPRTAEERRYYRTLQRQVSAAGLDDTVVFHESVPHHEVPEHYRRASILVNVSDTGSLDKVVLEAMATETPVLTSNEAFEPVLSGLDFDLVFPAGDRDALVDRLGTFLDADTDALGRAPGESRRRPQRHSTDRHDGRTPRTGPGRQELSRRPSGQRTYERMRSSGRLIGS